MNVISYIISIAMYILLSLGLQTIANRRGIRHAWLAWLPVGNVWVLASIADDFKLKIQGKQRKLRYWLPALLALTLVLSMVVLVLAMIMIAPAMEVLTYEDLMTLYEIGQGDSVSHMYAPAEEALMEDIERRLTEALSEDLLEQMTVTLFVLLGVSLVMLPVSIAAAVMEYICLYNLFDSCEPQNKTLYLLLSLLLGVSGLCVFLCRDKDLGMVSSTPQLPGGDQNYWQQG